MSWSIRAIGRASKVAVKYREDADRAKESCKNIPAEAESIEKSAQIVETFCAGLEPGSAVDVTGNGTCVTRGDGSLTQASFNLSFQPIYYGFVD